MKQLLLAESDKMSLFPLLLPVLDIGLKHDIAHLEEALTLLLHSLVGKASVTVSKL